MFLIVVGRGSMGKIVEECAGSDDAFDRIETVEPMENIWPSEKADLIIDFSHPEAIKGIYEYCRERGGNIPVVMGTTGQTHKEEEMIKLLSKICPLDRRSNFSRGVAAMDELAVAAEHILQGCDIGVEEIHHSDKADAPSGTAKTLCDLLGVPHSEAVSLRLGTVFGQHRVSFALEDEVLEITHTAYSRRIFARGAIEAGKKMVSVK